MAKKKSFYRVAGNREVEQVEGTSYKIKEVPDMEFFFYKDTIWHLIQVNTGLKAFYGKTQKEVKEKVKSFVNNFNKDLLRQSRDNAQKIIYVKKDYEKFSEQKNEFQKIFGFAPPVCVFTGRLDVLKLDNLLKPTEGISLSDFISSKYGESTAKLVEEML